MTKVGFYYHPDYLKHDTGYGHAERPDRLRYLTNYLLQVDLWHSLDHLRPTPGAKEWVAKVHPEVYINMIEKRCSAGETILDAGDTHVCRESYDVALLAAGAVMQAVDDVLTEKISRAFCAVRPPGHHAETATVMGFCLFNNVAVGARYAQQKHGLHRVAILDWDVHHGNGTQEIFYEDPSVFYISLHQYPFYPGTGAANETGEGKGHGFTLNCPMKAGSTEKEYFAAFRERIIPALQKFRPELLIISSGFGAHKDDPLANINLTDGSFGELTKMAMDVAEKYCGGRIVSVLEGGYNLEALAHSVEKHLEELM